MDCGHLWIPILQGWTLRLSQDFLRDKRDVHIVDPCPLSEQVLTSQVKGAQQRLQAIWTMGTPIGEHLELGEEAVTVALGPAAVLTLALTTRQKELLGSPQPQVFSSSTQARHRCLY